MNNESFSKRYGFGPEESEISIRDDAPPDVRAALLKIAEGEVNLTPDTIRDVLLCSAPCCESCRIRTTGATPIFGGECQYLMQDAPWYRVYDFVEALYRDLPTERAERWAELVNEYFLEAGVGWRLVDGQLESRGSEQFETSVDSARKALEAGGLQTARQEIHEALRDLSRRPDPDLTGAVHHGMAALECTAREVAGDSKATLGEVIKRNPDLFPKPLDSALVKMWGYASETGRHVREGQAPTRAEAELVVGVAASCCSYLAALLAESR